MDAEQQTLLEQLETADMSLGFLVLLAALIRLFALNFTQHAQSAPAGERLPD